MPIISHCSFGIPDHANEHATEKNGWNEHDVVVVIVILLSVQTDVECMKILLDKKSRYSPGSFILNKNRFTSVTEEIENQ